MDSVSLIGGGRFDKALQVPFHQHDSAELVLVERGRCRMLVAGDDLPCEPGCVAVLPGGVPHAQRNDGRVVTRYLIYRGGADFGDDPRVLPLPLGGAEHRWFIDCQEGLRAVEGPPQAVLDALLTAILAQLGSVERERAEAAGEDPRLLRARRYLDQRCDRGVSIDELTALCELSSSHLTLLFRRSYGCGPLRYHQQRRLERAQQLLRDPYLPVARVATACGYHDGNYFARLFARRVGCSPSAWRRRSAAS